MGRFSRRMQTRCFSTAGLLSTQIPTLAKALLTILFLCRYLAECRWGAMSALSPSATQHGVHAIPVMKGWNAMGYGRAIALSCLFILVAAVCGPAARGQTVTPAQEAAIAENIKNLSTQWSTAYLQNDPSILERIWAADFVYVEPSGHRFTKAEGIASLAASGEKHTVSAAQSIDVRVYGGGTVAVDIGDYIEAGQGKDGKPFGRTSRFTNVWVLKDGAWQCVSGHASAILPRP